MAGRVTVRNDTDDTSTPIAALFGWGNSQLRHLVKYSAIFEEQGFTTVNLPLSLIPMQLRPGVLSTKYRKKVIKALTKLTQDNSSRPIFLMCFCQTGAMVMVNLFQYLDSNPENNFNIVGTIFDSGPIVLKRSIFKVGQRAFLANFNNPSKVTRRIMNWLARIVNYKNINFNEFTRLFDTVVLEYTALNPQLFLVSRADKIIDYEDVISIAELRRTRGAPVYLRVWDEGDHVAILRKNEEEYKETLKNFIVTCLNKENVSHITVEPCEDGSEKQPVLAE